jgi:hypothetical protein
MIRRGHRTAQAIELRFVEQMNVASLKEIAAMQMRGSSTRPYEREFDEWIEGA